MRGPRNPAIYLQTRSQKRIRAIEKTESKEQKGEREDEKKNKFVWDGRSNFKCYTYNGKRCTGIHRFLRESFYPDFEPVYNRPPQHQNTEEEEEGKGKGNKKTKKSKRKAPLQNNQLRKAMLRGSRVDREMTYWTRHGSLPKRHDSMSAKVVNAFREWGWKPSESQVVVGLPKSRLVTVVDMTVIDAKGRLILVELKVGYDASFTNAGGQRMCPPLSHIESHPLNHALMQASVGAYYYEQTRMEKVDQIYVVHCFKPGCHRHRVPGWMPAALAVVKTLASARV